MGTVEKNQLNTQQLALSQEHPQPGRRVPPARSPRDTPALSPCPKGLPLSAALVAAGAPLPAGNVHVAARPAPSPAVTSLLDLGEVALKSGCISGALSLVKRLHLLSSIQLDGLYLETELLNFLNKVHFV